MRERRPEAGDGNNDVVESGGTTSVMKLVDGILLLSLPGMLAVIWMDRAAQDVTESHGLNASLAVTTPMSVGPIANVDDLKNIQ